MSEATAPEIRLRIQPEPNPDELVAILVASQSATYVAVDAAEPRSRWEETARREQLRQSLADHWDGWSR